MAITHALSATTPDDPNYEIRPSHWNAAHVEARTISGNTVGASTVSGSNIVYQAGNNITLSATSDTIVFVGPSPSGGAFSAGVSTGGNTAGATGVSGTQLVLAGGANITVSQTTGANGATVSVVGANQTVQTQNMVSVLGSTGNISFANGNGITFGGNASTITASHNGLTSQSNQAFSAPNGSSAFQTLSFADSQGVSWSNSNGSVVATVKTDYAASNHSHGNPQLNLTNLSGTTASNSAGFTLSLSAAAPGGAGFSAGVSNVGNTGGDTGVTGTRLVFVGSQNITLNQATDANGATISFSGGAGAAGNTGFLSAGAATASLGTVSFADSNGVSWGINGQTITATVKTDYLTTQSAQAWSGSNASSTFQTLTFSNANGASWSNSNGAVVLSYTVPTLTSWTVSDTATSATVGRLAFGAANGLSFGLSTSNNGNHTVTATYTVPTQTNQTIGLYASSNTTGQSSSTTVDARSLTVRGAGVASVGYSAGELIVSVPSGGGANFSAGVSTGGNTAGSTGITGTRLVFVGTNNITLSQSTDANGGTLSIRGPDLLSAGVTNAGNTSGNTGFVTGQFNLQGGNNITLSGSTNGGSMSVTISAANQTNQSLGIYASSGTMGQSSSSTYDARSLTLVGSGAASVGWSNGSFIISAPNAGAGNVTFSAGANSAGLASIVFSNSNGVSFGLNGSTITASAAGGGGGVGVGVSTMGNTAGSTGTVTTGNAYLVGSGVISLSQSTGGAGSNATISILAPATSSLVGTGGLSISTNGSTISIYEREVSYWDNFQENGYITLAGTAQGNSLVSIQPCRIELPVALSNVLVPMNINVGSAANNSSAHIDVSASMVFYTRTGSTLSSVTSFAQTFNQTWSSNATGTVTGVQGLTLTGNAVTIQPNNYWVAVHVSTTNTATGGANTTALGATCTMVLVQSVGSAANLIKPWGAQTNNSYGLLHGQGVISTGATRASIAFSDYTVTGTRAVVAPVAFALRSQTVTI